MEVNTPPGSPSRNKDFGLTLRRTIESPSEERRRKIQQRKVAASIAISERKAQRTIEEGKEDEEQHLQDRLGEERPKTGEPHYRIRTATADESSFEEVTPHEKRLMMLGHIVKTKRAEPLYYREDFCGVCGIQHSNPKVLDMYPYCSVCAHTLREPAVLRGRYLGVLERQPLEILMATYGDPFDCTKVLDVTAICDKLTHEYKTRDRLYIRSTVNLCKLFNKDAVPDDPDGTGNYDFLPGKQKQLRIRYRMNGKLHGSVAVDTTVTSRFPTGFFLTTPHQRYLTIVSCTYGHPKGRSDTGRMSYDITEKVQGLVDMNGGSYLVLSSQTPLARYFGDPCPGYVKDLYIMYDIDGRVGSVTGDEINGHLRRKILVQESPVVAPLFFVVSAAYGITPSGRRERLLTLSNEVKKIMAVEHKLRQGQVMQLADVALMRRKDKIFAEREYFRQTQCKFVDITEKMQRIVDAGRNALVLDAANMDCNAMFSNPIPVVFSRPASPEIDNALPPVPSSGTGAGASTCGTVSSAGGSAAGGGDSKGGSSHGHHHQHHHHHHDHKDGDGHHHGHHHHHHHSHKHGHGHGHGHGEKPAPRPHAAANKLLEIYLECQGHDSEKTTDSREVTLSGYPRNFITGKTARFAIPVKDDRETGKGLMEESIEFRTNNSHPIIIIQKALYGYLAELSKQVDVTVEVQGLVSGRFLEIGREVDLDKLFTNPCRGLKKQLRIDYMTRGFSGSIRTREKNDLLVATVELGYPPIPAVDDPELTSKYS